MKPIKSGQTGFTLLEIMVAVSILTMSLLVILDLHGTTLLKSGRAENVTQAVMLARLKLAEIQLDLEKDISKGEFPGDNKTMEGTFDEPYEKYKWEVAIRKVEIPVPPQPESSDEEGAGMDMMLSAFKTIAEQIGKAAREVRITVKWDELGEEQSISAATHIVQL